VPSKKVPVVRPRALSSEQREAATKQLERKFEGSDALTYGRTIVQTSSSLTAQALGLPDNDPRYIQRAGRVLGDGSRRGARLLRKMTINIPAARGMALEEHARATRESMSDTVDRALAAIGIGVEPPAAQTSRGPAYRTKKPTGKPAAKKKAVAKKKGRA